MYKTQKMENFNLGTRVKEIRTKRGLSQEQLAEASGLSLRTIQRIENGETLPRGDTLIRLAASLQISPQELIDSKIIEDNNFLTLLSLSQFGFVVFPLLGIVIPLVLWILKKDKVKNTDALGRSILNFQITWSLIFFSILFLSFPFIGFPVFLVLIMYLFNLVMIIKNTIRFSRTGETKYKPSYTFLK